MPPLLIAGSSPNPPPPPPPSPYKAPPQETLWGFSPRKKVRPPKPRATRTVKKRLTDFDPDARTWTPEECQDFLCLVLQAGQEQNGGYRERVNAQFIRNKATRVTYANMAQSLLQSMITLFEQTTDYSIVTLILNNDRAHLFTDHQPASSLAEDAIFYRIPPLIRHLGPAAVARFTEHAEDFAHGFAISALPGVNNIPFRRGWSRDIQYSNEPYVADVGSYNNAQDGGLLSPIQRQRQKQQQQQQQQQHSCVSACANSRAPSPSPSPAASFADGEEQQSWDTPTPPEFFMPAGASQPIPGQGPENGTGRSAYVPFDFNSGSFVGGPHPGNVSFAISGLGQSPTQLPAPGQINNNGPSRTRNFPRVIDQSWFNLDQLGAQDARSDTLAEGGAEEGDEEYVPLNAKGKAVCRGKLR